MNEFNKIFHLDNDVTRPIKGVGIIFYKYNKNYRMELLLLKNDNAKYEDIGGLVNSTDLNYIDTACRNVVNKTNNTIQYENITDIENKRYINYNYKLNYVIILIKASSYIKHLTSEDFKTNEIDWISLYRLQSQSIAKNSRHSKLSSKELIYRLKEIEYNHRLRLVITHLNQSPTTSDEFSSESFD